MLSVIAGIVALLAGLLWFGQRSLIYYPDRSDPGPASAALESGSDVTLTTSDGLTLRAWRIDPREPNGMAALYLPGNGGNRLGRVSIGQSLAEEGFTVLLLDYRGYGGNPGSPNEQGLLRDARAAVVHLTDAGSEPSNLVYVGESIGTGVAVQLAAEAPPAGVVLRSPYTRLADVADRVIPVPLGWALRDKFDTLTHISEVHSPVTVLAGDADTLIDPAQSRAVADAAPNLHEFVLTVGADHNDPVWFGPYVAAKAAEFAQP